jgi:hemerythrin
MAVKLKNVPKSLIVGQDNIDYEHDVLFSLFEKVHNAVENNDYLYDLDKVIKELVAYVSFHFKNEEKLMVKAGYTNLKEHKKEHSIMTAHVHGYLFRFKSENESQRNIAIDINDFVKSWLIEHIADEDMKLAEYLK